MSETGHCPNCGRPISREYRVEKDACQLWAQLAGSILVVGGHLAINTRPDPRAVADCFFHTTKRVKRLQDELADAGARANAAQNALRRHHAAQAPKREQARPVEPMFRDGARIEAL